MVQVATELCGFLTIIAGTFLLHATKDLEVASIQDVYRLNPKALAAATQSPGNGAGPGGGLLLGGGGGGGGGSLSSSAPQGILLGSLERGERKENAARERSSTALLGLLGGDRMAGDGPAYHAVAGGEDGSGKGGGAGARTGASSAAGGGWFK